MVRSLLLDRQYFWYLFSLLFVGEALLGLLIINKVAYTKIDWVAYMQQVDGFIFGERDYSKLEGETGPLVYPALHLYIYAALHQLLPNDRVRAAQYIFLLVYLVTFTLVGCIYYFCGSRNRHIPQILLVPLTLSKRAHSVYLLRLFNDPLTMILLYAAVVGFMCRTTTGWRVGSVLFSMALGVKMNILLFLPGLLVLLVQYRGIFGTLESTAIMASIQVRNVIASPSLFFITALPFLAHDSLAYFNSAFDFSRQFLYKWTVNWRFISESTFLSKEWATGLLMGHLTILMIFAAYRWAPNPVTLLHQACSTPQTTITEIPLVLFTSNLIGMTFARSLHYQFHVWYFHQIPLLLYLGGAWGNPILGPCLWIMIEYAWATAPSTNFSSGILFFSHIVMLGGLLLHTKPIFNDLSSSEITLASTRRENEAT
ncbi:hypothetical protein TREMEDRAFT_68105 [Tremella mesenterica DSM 1558]|uniref:uncharacterized protein n=1 Tax=Tremella mesenterica (strain ATCC 24925 / CBS 8224 / DSM 1558 / NBRC 9311 / NRRL Y-6157 / RJB 2259-6 / UBC 559-6) TaxID=578456 RepID=UPI0003F4A4D3|nr:uncharacterized protein TREMEDRAFT_68105 [Tremella mesenterica DSM 1558]EIW70538.1 hypothetical protein TREMEDRAFT_68105 [Tremella mesenterica DSM 1558]